MFVIPNYRPLYPGKIEKCFNQPVVYNGKNFILTLVQEGKPGESVVIANNGFTINDPFCSPVPKICQNAWIFGLYYKLSDPALSAPKRKRVEVLWEQHPEFFGCQGLDDAEQEILELIKFNYSRVPFILVGFTKSATMFLNAKERYPSNVSIIAVCPIFRGTFSTMSSIMKEELKLLYPAVGWILTEHLVDEDISFGSAYLKKADYSAIEKVDVDVVISSMDNKLHPTFTDLIHPANIFFSTVSSITDKVIGKHDPDETGYKSNGFLSFKSQMPTFGLPEGHMHLVYSSMPMTFSHPIVRKLIQHRVDQKNEKYRRR